MYIKAFSVPLKATEQMALRTLSTSLIAMAQAGHRGMCLRAILGWTVKAVIALTMTVFTGNS